MVIKNLIGTTRRCVNVKTNDILFKKPTRKVNFQPYAKTYFHQKYSSEYLCVYSIVEINGLIKYDLFLFFFFFQCATYIRIRKNDYIAAAPPPVFFFFCSNIIPGMTSITYAYCVYSIKNNFECIMYYVYTPYGR